MHLLNSAITRREALMYGDLATTRHYLSSNTVSAFIANIIRHEDWEQDFKTLNLYSLTLLSISDIVSLVNGVPERPFIGFFMVLLLIEKILFRMLLMASGSIW